MFCRLASSDYGDTASRNKCINACAVKPWHKYWGWVKAIADKWITLWIDALITDYQE